MIHSQNGVENTQIMTIETGTKRTARIAIYTATTLRDPRTHFWYDAPDGSVRRLCDDSEWPPNTRQRLKGTLSLGCEACKTIYVDEGTRGAGRFELYPYIAPIGQTMIDSLYIGTPSTERSDMEIRPLPLSTYARFFEATTQSAKDRIVSEFRSPGGFDFYWALRNALSQTHWETNDLSTFEDALDPLVDNIPSDSQKKHYAALGEGYIKFWKRHPDAQVFRVPDAWVKIDQLTIKVNYEIGMQSGDDWRPLKLHLRAKTPSRHYRLAIQEVTSKVTVWDNNWVPELLDTRAGETTVLVPRPDRIEQDLEAEANNFAFRWNQMEREREEAEE